MNQPILPHARYLLMVCLLLGVSPVGFAADTPELPARMRIVGEAVSKAFGEPAENLEACTVGIVPDPENPDAVRLLGAVVSKDGFIVTKASDLPDKVWVSFASGEVERAKVIGKDRVNDIAFLKVNRTMDVAVSWGKSLDLKRGSWLVSVVPGGNVFHVGVVSANRRTLERVGGVLGVFLGSDGEGIGGIMVGRIMKDSGAEKSGLQRGDVITAIEGTSVLKSEDLKKIITNRDAEDIVGITVERGTKKLDLKIRLGHRTEIFDRGSRNQMMSGNTSRRRMGFDEIVQHDIPLEAEYMGGPVLGLDGKAVGINIARANRAETYLLPSEQVLDSIERILSGELDEKEDEEDAL